jgi:tetrahydromethanopterin S-methyltransferase subunit G
MDGEARKVAEVPEVAATAAVEAEVGKEVEEDAGVAVGTVVGKYMCICH